MGRSWRGGGGGGGQGPIGFVGGPHWGGGGAPRFPEQKHRAIGRALFGSAFVGARTWCSR
jgi:hypothetical protein